MEYADDLVSVIMPCHDAAAYLEEALCSVQAQTLAGWELIAFDDASRDGSASILRAFANRDRRIVAVCGVFPHPIGAGQARNFALYLAKGRYVAFLDADDTWLPEKLEIQSQYMRKHESALCSTHMETIGADGETRGHYSPEPGCYDFKSLLMENVASTSAMMIDRRQCADLRFGPMKRQEDYYAWMRQTVKGLKINVLPGRFTRYRLRPFYLKRKLGDALIRMYINRRYLKLSYRELLAISVPYAVKSISKTNKYYADEPSGRMNREFSGKMR
jgi:teichuronic acid biosynthesis glycosyltransferase TuaG